MSDIYGLGLAGFSLFEPACISTRISHAGRLVMILEDGGFLFPTLNK